jgi:hypothetical protein
MTIGYRLPPTIERSNLGPNQVYLIANGDLRSSANQRCWAAQAEMEQGVAAAVAAAGWNVVRAHPFKESERHGFIGSQKEGMGFFAASIPMLR